MNTKRARALFAAAVALYVVWIGALVALAAVSGARPSEVKTPHVPPAALAPSAPDQPRD